MAEPVRMDPKAPSRAQASAWLRRVLKEECPGLKRVTVDRLLKKLETTGRIEKTMWDCVREGRAQRLRDLGLTPREDPDPKLPPDLWAEYVRRVKRTEYAA